MNKNYWDLTDRPHTERKLIILEKYLEAWATIIFKQWINYHYKNFKTAYYIDCFAGRGKYHKNGKQDSVDGSPLIALKCAKYFREKYKGEVELKCIFIEKNKNNVNNLRKFCTTFEGKVDYSIIHGDVNSEILKIIPTINSNAAFFFIDPFSLKDLSFNTVNVLIQKKGPKDIILNYICGTNRVIGAISKISDSKITHKYIESIEKFHTLPVLKQSLNKPDREKLHKWVDEIFKDTDLKYHIAYEMISSSRAEPVYYLLFASRVEVAKKVMGEIFKKEDSECYNGQLKLLQNENFDI